MKKDIILAGVGGQGILSIAVVIGDVVLKNNWFLKQAEVHGMSQRGGDVQSNLRIADHPIMSDLIPIGGADIIISLEPMEALRHVPYLAPTGWIITSSVPFVNIDNYPPVDSVLSRIQSYPNHILLDIDALVKEAGVPAQAGNMVLLGASIPMLGLSFEMVEESVKSIFARKGDNVIQGNVNALQIGYRHSKH